jgi:DNA (cytosine-5)-methyltransferase 1
MKTLHLFAGAGGGLLADLILGHEPIGAVEIEPFCCEVLRERKDDGWWPELRVHETDIRTFDASEYAGRVDCVSGGFPCQDISAAGRGKGLAGERSGLWSEFARVIREVRPRFAFIENSPMLVTRGLDRVLSDLAEMGFDAQWAVISAADVEAPHLRERIWILADAVQSRSQGSRGKCELEHREKRQAPGSDWWKPKPDVCRVADGVAHRVDRLKALGNGQVPLQAALAWRILSG